MGSLASMYIKLETLKALAEGVAKKGEKGIEITLSINDTVNDYGQNISSYVSQSKEQREGGTKKFYVGNGKVFWTDGKISKAESSIQTQQQPEPMGAETGDDIPF